MLKCSKCKIYKPINEFHKNKSALSGYSNYCKQCKKLTRKKPQTKIRLKKYHETINKYIVYEFYNLDNECIYIGQSFTFHRRLISHMYHSKFANEIRTIKCNVFNNYPDMVFYEAQLIIKCKPKYNSLAVNSPASLNSIEPLETIEYTI